MKRWSFVVWVMILWGCASSEPRHPWLDLGDGSPHQIVEFSGANAGQLVIAMDPSVTREQALALGRLIQSQAPPGATVNARLYNHEPTARGWRQAPAELRIEHLLVVVGINPSTGLNEVRWTRPEDPPEVSGPPESSEPTP